MKLSVLICAHNSRMDYLARVLQALKEQPSARIGAGARSLDSSGPSPATHIASANSRTLACAIRVPLSRIWRGSGGAVPAVALARHAAPDVPAGHHGQGAPPPLACAPTTFSDKFGHSNCVILRDSCKEPILCKCCERADTRRFPQDSCIFTKY